MTSEIRKLSTPIAATFLLLFTAVSFFAFPLFAAQEKLSGEAFADPEHIVSMPPAWHKKEIQHDETIKGADLVVNLDQSEFVILEPIIKEYAQKNNLKIFVNSGTCGVSNRNLLQRKIDIGSFCCPPGNNDRLPGLRFHTIGIAPIALIVHPDNPITDVSLEEAQKTFMGEIQRWSELKNAKITGASGQLIQPIAFIHCKKRPGHWRLLLDNEDLFSVRLQTVVAIPEMIFQVASNPRAIGYEIPCLALQQYQDQGQVKTIKINGMDPLLTDFLVRNQYPLYRVFNMTTWEDEVARKPEAKKLVDYLMEYMALHGEKYWIASSKRLRQAGWKFKGNELIGAPE